MMIRGTLPQIISQLRMELTKVSDLTREYVCDLKLYRKRRSLDANAYFHVLVDKLRQVRRISFAHCKNDLITSYGQIEYFREGEAVFYKTNAPPEYIREREEVHMKFLKADVDDKTGEDVYFYQVWRGSHTYNTLEMSRLIDGTVAECQDEGIETMPPDELKRMMEAYERTYQRRMERDVSKEAEEKTSETEA